MTLLRDERGGVLVMVALCLPIMILFASFVVDVGHWFEHKRHLQLQADAGALAAGGAFTIPCSDSPIEADARRYSGDPASPTRFNTQVAPTSDANIHVLINSAQFWNDGGVDYSDGGGPCAAKRIDVKITESDLPFFLGFGANFVPAINAHARVEILQKTSSAGALPVGVPDVNPKTGSVTFINEVTGAVLGSRPLVNTGATTSAGDAIWDNSANPFPLNVPSAHVGVRVALSGSTSTTCGDPLVACFDSLSHIRGWTTSATTNAVFARNVYVLPGSCVPDGYFAVASCSAGLQADIDFGNRNIAATPGAEVWATVNGGGTKFSLNRPPTGSTVWSAFSGVPTTAAGGNTIELHWKWEQQSGTWTTAGQTLTCTSRGNNPCKQNADIGYVQRSFLAADTLSGPIRLAQLGDGGVGSGANSFQIGTTHNMVLRIAVKGTLQNAASASDPPVYMRVAGNVNGSGNQSQNQSLDCDPNYSNLSDELANGCRPAYSLNSGTACPSNASSLWGTAQPWNCVALQTGQATNQVAAGLNTRILGSSKPSSCTSPNHWSSFPNLPEGDPRITQVFLTPFGSFFGSGSGTVPVTGFATFYVTGWTAQGGGFANPCQGHGDDSVPGDDPGVIVGHFIKYIDSLNQSGGGGALCDFTSFGTCVAVLTQ
jgi:Putative Flp pilus-assembly TadE/G-like